MIYFTSTKLANLFPRLALILASLSSITNANNLVLETSIPEESPAGTMVFNLSHQIESHIAKSTSGSKISLSSCGISYETLRLSGARDAWQYFDIESKTGAIRIAKGQRIDRDKLENSKQEMILYLDVIVIPPSKLNPSNPTCNNIPSTVKIQVNITDINDNKPYFNPSLTNKIEFLESDQLGKRVQLPLANDVDFGFNSVWNYSLRWPSRPEETGPFFLIIENFTSSDKLFPVPIPYLIQNGSIDREMKDKYQVILVASDGPGQTAEFDLEIIILDGMFISM